MDVGIVVGTLSSPAAARTAITDAGGAVRELNPGVVPGDVDVVLMDDPATIPPIIQESTTPLLPLGNVPGLPSVPRSHLAEAISSLRADECTVEERNALSIELPDGTSVVGVHECVILAATPATISEFSLAATETQLATYRADGVAVATPAGSHGYFRDIGGPILSGAVDGLGVCTIAPYRTDPDHWVVGGSVSVRPIRDETDVIAVVDGAAIGTIDAGDAVRVGPGRSYPIYEVPQSVSPFRDRVNEDA